MKTYYDILGISKQADKTVIRKAFKHLVLIYHPDTNKSPEAEERFKEINEAYQILSNSSKRWYYDFYTEENNQLSEYAPISESESSSYKQPSEYYKEKIKKSFLKRLINDTYKSITFQKNAPQYPISIILIFIFGVAVFSSIFLLFNKSIHQLEQVEHNIAIGSYEDVEQILKDIYNRGIYTSKVFYYKSLLAFERDKDYESALLYIENAIRRSKNYNIDYHLLKAKISTFTKNHFYKIPHEILPILKKDPDHPEANLYFGEYYLYYKFDYSSALSCFKKALIDKELAPQPRINYAITLKKQKKYLEAFKAFKEAESSLINKDKTEDLAIIYYYMADLHLIQKDTAKSCDYWKKSQNFATIDLVDYNIKRFCSN